MSNTDESGFDPLRHRTIHDQILSEAFKEKEGLKLKEKNRKVILEIQKSFQINIQINPENNLRVLGMLLDNLTMNITIAIAKSLEIILSRKEESLGRTAAIRINETVTDENCKLLEPFLNLYEKTFKEYHRFTKTATTDDLTVEIVSKKWDEIINSFHELYPSERQLFPKLDHVPELEASAVAESIPAEKSNKPTIIQMFEFCLKNGYEVTEHNTLMLIENAYWEEDKKTEAKEILDNLIKKYQLNKERWSLIICLEKKADRLLEENELVDACDVYRRSIDLCEKFGKDNRYFELEIKYLRCQIKSLKTTNNVGDLIKYTLEKRYERILKEDGNFLLAKEILLTKILLFAKGGNISKVIEIIDDIELYHDLSPRIGAQLEFDTAKILIENIDYWDNEMEKLKVIESILLRCKERYEKIGDLNGLIDVMKFLIEYCKYSPEDQNVEDLDRLENLNERIELCIYQEELDSELVEDLINEGKLGGIVQLYESSKLNMGSLSHIEEKYGIKIYEDLFYGKLDRFLIENRKIRKIFFNKYSVKLKEELDDLEIRLSYCDKWYRHIKKKMNCNNKELRYLKSLLLENEWKVQRVRKFLTPELVISNLKTIRIAEDLIELWIEQDSSRGKNRWKRNLAMISPSEERIEALEEIREFWRELDSTKYIQLSIDYAKFTGKWEDVLDDSSDIRSNDVLLFQFYCIWSRHLEKEGDLKKSLEIIRRAIVIINRKEKVQLPTRLTGRGIGFKRIFKSEVDLLIKLEEDADAETKVDNLLDRGLISEIKALNYKFEINCSTEDFHRALDIISEIENLILEISFISEETIEENEEVIDSEDNYRDEREYEEEEEVNASSAKISAMRSMNYSKRIRVYDLMGDKQNLVIWLLSKYNFDKKHNIDEKHLARSSNRIARIFKEDSKNKEAIEWFEKGVRHNENCNLENFNNYKSMAFCHLQVANEYGDEGEEFEVYTNLKKSFEYFSKSVTDANPADEKRTNKLIVRIAELSYRISNITENDREILDWKKKSAVDFSLLDRNKIKPHQYRREYALWEEIGDIESKNNDTEQEIRPSVAYWKGHDVTLRRYKGKDMTKHEFNAADKFINLIMNEYFGNNNLVEDIQTSELKNILQDFRKCISQFYIINSSKPREKEIYENFLCTMYQYFLLINEMRNIDILIEDVKQLEENCLHILIDRQELLKEDFIENIIGLNNDYGIILDRKWVEEMFSKIPK